MQTIEIYRNMAADWLFQLIDTALNGSTKDCTNEVSNPVGVD
jgi:hypothetical protein